MAETFTFLREYPIFAGAAVIFNLILASMIITKILAAVNNKIYDAKAGRGEQKGKYKIYMEMARKSIEEYERKNNKTKLYKRAVDKARQAGYHGEYAPLIYLSLITVIPLLLFSLVFTVNFPDAVGGLVVALYVPAVTEYILKSKKKSIISKFKMSSYKIYKYLHNQISAGVQVTEAIKTVYEVTDNKDLRLILIKLAGAYGRTLDIDFALDQFQSYFKIPEAQTLAVALKQGIDTGDNQEILQNQEDVMFDKYVDYIQAETEACRSRGVIAAIFFTAIIVTMICVPMYNDMIAGLRTIFFY